MLVLGLGETGLAMARWLQRCDASVRVADTRLAPARLAELQAELPDCSFVGGPWNDAACPALLEQVDFIAVSPGLTPQGDLAALLPAAAARQLPVWSEIELFAQALAALRAEQGYQPKVLAITGTNGKTTVTRMTGLLCEHAGLSVAVAGNISPAALDVLGQALDAQTLPQVWVLELSSFQLHATYSLQADAATVLNLSQDHLDWHGDMAAYAADKSRIFAPKTVRVLNRQDTGVMAMAAPDPQSLTFGIDGPKQANDFGLVVDNGMQWLAQARVDAALAPASGRSRRRQPEQVAPVSVTRLMPVDALHVRGLHNAANALAALALCRAIDLPLAPLLHALRSYHGEPHRVAFVARIDEVEYIDDSKGTNVGATVAALEGLGGVSTTATSGQDQERRIVLIAGGEGKGQDFQPLAQAVSCHTKAVLLIGKDAPALRAALQTQAGCPELVDCASLEDAVCQAAALAQAGDQVLLSPACASLDMFDNYVHRGQVFARAVQEIALSRGEVLI